MTSAAEHFVIVGGGHAAAQAAVSLRQADFSGTVTLVTEDRLGPYQRPPLSKGFLAGSQELDRIRIRPQAVYEKLGIAIRTGSRAVSLDRAARVVGLDDGTDIRYDKLLLATGSRVRRLSGPVAAQDRTLYLRSVDDSIGLRQHLTAGSRLVVVGGGYLGLEVASVAARAGLRVSVLEAADTVLARVSGPEVARYLMDLHVGEGVDVRTGAAVSGFQRTGTGVIVTCQDGSRHEAEVALIAIGVVPNIELGEKAGLDCDDGILVDQRGRTSDEDIFAAGDCTRHHNALLGRWLRLESVHNAVEQAKVAAAGMCGKPTEYSQVPRFWSDQYGHKLQTVGVADGHDDRLVGPERARGFAVFYFRNERLVATDAVDAPDALALGRRLIAERRQLDRGSLRRELTQPPAVTA